MKHLSKYIFSTFSIRCTFQAACEEDNIGRLPNSIDSVEAIFLEEASKFFLANGWRDFEFEGEEGIACPSCVKYLKGIKKESR